MLQSKMKNSENASTKKHVEIMMGETYDERDKDQHSFDPVDDVFQGKHDTAPAIIECRKEYAKCIGSQDKNESEITPVVEKVNRRARRNEAQMLNQSAIPIAYEEHSTKKKNSDPVGSKRYQQLLNLRSETRNGTMAEKQARIPIKDDIELAKDCKQKSIDSVRNKRWLDKEKGDSEAERVGKRSNIDEEVLEVRLETINTKNKQMRVKKLE